MNFNFLNIILLEDNVYELLKENEKELFELIPELEKCKGFNQNNKWHIFDVYEHIIHVVSFVQPNKYLRLAALFHDIGKPLTYTEDKNGVGHFYNHWSKSVEIFNKYKNMFNLTTNEIKLISNLINYHDINIGKMNTDDMNDLNRIFGDSINLLFSLKRADLLAQSSEYHYLLEDIIKQEKLIKTLKNNNYFIWLFIEYIVHYNVLNIC